MKNQVKFFVLIVGILYGFSTLAQGSDCATATPASPGINTAIGPSTGEGADDICAFPNGPATNANWYTYTPVSNVSVTVASCMSGVDTRLVISSGVCGAQTCVASNDDACEVSPGGDTFASSITFAATEGTTYYIQWDDRWSADGFDWSLITDPLPCDGLPVIIGDPCDFVGDGDGIVDETCTCVELLSPECATLLSPTNGASDVLDESGNVELSWMLNGSYPADAINIYVGSSSETLGFIGSVGGGVTSVNVTGLSPFDIHYWSAVPTNSVGEASGCEIFMFDTYDVPPFAPDCATLISPLDLATEVVFNPVDSSITLHWANSSGGPPVDEIRIYWGTDPSELTFVSYVNEFTTNFNVTGLEPGTTYFWSIVPTRESVEASDCDIRSFTTEVLFDCPLLGLNFGDPCEDGCSNTILDTIEPDCTCVGSPFGSNPCDGNILIEEGFYPDNMISDCTFPVNVCFNGGTEALTFDYYSHCDGIVTVSSSVDPDLPDTRVSIIGGSSPSCGGLYCLASDDDGGDGASSLVSFAVVANEKYIIEWDNRWSNEEFDFEIRIEDNPCPTDFVANGTTDGADFSFFLGNFGLTCSEFCGCPTDLNNDGITDGTDFSIFLGNFGLTCAAP